MNKKAAIRAMQNGKRVTHEYFCKEEWITIEGGRVVMEDGCSCTLEEFWVGRSHIGWLQGWSIA